MVDCVGIEDEEDEHITQATCNRPTAMPDGARMQDHVASAHAQGLSTTVPAAVRSVGQTAASGTIDQIFAAHQCFDHCAATVIFFKRIQDNCRCDQRAVAVHPQLRLRRACIVLDESCITHTERCRAAATRKGLLAHAQQAQRECGQTSAGHGRHLSSPEVGHQI